MSRGTKTEVRPGVWKLRVFTGERRPSGSPIQATKTLNLGDGQPGSGVRLADRELAKMVAEVDRGLLKVGNETVGNLLTRWLAHCESLGLSPTTMREHKRIVNVNLRPTIGDVKLTKLRAGDLDKLYASMTARGVKASTVRRTHAVIGAAVKQATKWDLVDSNVALKASPPKVRAPEVEAPTPDEVRALIAAAQEVEPTMAPLILLAALSGARRGELCALRWSDIDFTTNTLTISRSVYETPGGGWAEKTTKTFQSRSLSLDPVAVDMLKAHRADVDALADKLGLTVIERAFMFSQSPQGLEPVRPDWLSKAFKRAADAAGVSTHLHCLRHFSATQSIAAGFDVRTVAGRLGHADASVTLKVYSHALEQKDRELAASLGSLLTGPHHAQAG